MAVHEPNKIVTCMNFSMSFHFFTWYLESSKVQEIQLKQYSNWNRKTSVRDDSIWMAVRHPKCLLHERTSPIHSVPNGLLWARNGDSLQVFWLCHSISPSEVFKSCKSVGYPTQPKTKAKHGHVLFGLNEQPKHRNAKWHLPSHTCCCSEA